MELEPGPLHPIEIVCAGQSDRGLRFTAEVGDRNFVIGEVDQLPGIAARLDREAARFHRRAGTIALFQVIAAPTDEEARRRLDAFVDRADTDAVGTMTGQMSLDPSDGMARKVLEKAAFIGFPLIVGSYESVAEQLTHVARHTPVSAAMLAFPDFEEDLDAFGERVLPLVDLGPHRRARLSPARAALEPAR